MFYVKRIDEKDDNNYTVYNVSLDHDIIYLLINIKEDLTWVKAENYRPVHFNQNSWPHQFTNQKTKVEHDFYSIIQADDMCYLIYFCEWCENWHKIDSRNCKIKD